ncbi:MAG: FG-GAP-like repeat-containing protein [Bacteroidia bacterium]|nr:FG-GAP-like repeat-containing protein [Bacteroidia bacterium]
MLLSAPRNRRSPLQHSNRITRFAKGMCIVLLLLPLQASGQTPQLLWSFDTRDASFGQTAAGDIDGDGKLELVFGCYRNDSSIYALNAEDGSLLWKFNAAKPGRDGCNDVATLIVDIDDDGIPEVIVPSSCNPTTFCFDGKTGAVKWSAVTRGSDSPPTIADIDGDGKLEILHGEFGGWVRCLNAEDGSLAWDLAVDMRSWIQTAPTLLDADGDGNMDFVVATWNSNAGDTNTIRAYRCSDRALLWSVPLADVVYHGTAVADFDRDGKPELAFGDYSGTLYVLNAEDGSIAWTKPSLGTGHYIGAPVTAGDINGDGNCELIAISWYKVSAYNGDGSVLWEHDIDGYGTAFRGAALADVDGDALLDAVFGTSKGALIALRGSDGAPLWTVDLAARYGDSRFALDHAPIIADFDKDGKLDVFIVGGHTEYPDFSANFGRAYALSIGRGAGPEWLMFQQNSYRNASLCTGSVNTVRLTSEDRPAAPALFPHPVGDVLNVRHEGLRTGRILDETGRIVASEYADGGTMSINIASLPSGAYFLVMEVDGMPQVRSFIKR